MKLSQTEAKLIWMPNVAEHMEYCGRICYNSFSRMTENSAVPFLEDKIKNKHWSVLEHAGIDISDGMPDLDKLMATSPEFGLVMSRAALGGIRYSDLLKYSSKYDTMEKALADKSLQRDKMLLSFEIVSSRYISQQFERHRNFSYAERSLRFVSIDKDSFEAVLPAGIRKNEELLKKVQPLLDRSVELYESMRSKGLSKDDCRSVLPLCTATRFIATGQITWWVDFLSKRYIPAASKEMICLCKDIYRQLPSAVQNIVDKHNKEQMEEADEHIKDQ